MNKELLEIVLKLRDDFSKGVTKMKNKSVSGLSKIRRGFQSMGAAVKKSLFNLKGLIAAFLALSALRGIIRFLKESAEAAKTQERALVTLNAALMASGQFSVEASRGFEQYAAALQDSLGIADELTLETLGMIEGLTGLAQEALPDAMNAVIQISNLYRVDFKNAALLLGKTLTSNMNAFSRYGIQVDLAGDAQQRLDQIIEGTAAGMVIAEAKMKTYEGQTIRAANSWGDLKEAIGAWITQSPVVVAIIALIGTWITRLTNSMNENKQAGTDLVGEGFAAIVKGGFAVVRTIIAVTKILTLAAKGALELGRAYLDLELGITIFFRQSLIALGNFIKGSINFMREGINTFIDWINITTGSNFERIGIITIDVAAAVDRAISVTQDRIDSFDSKISDLNETLVTMDNITNTLLRAEFELDDIIANTGDTAIETANNFGNMGDAIDEMTEAIDGAGGALSDMNDELVTTNLIFGTMINLIRRIHDGLEELGEAGLERIRLGEEGPGVGAPRFRGATARGQVARTKEIFDALEMSLIRASENLALSIQSGDVAAALKRSFEDIGGIIAQRVNESIAKHISGRRPTLEGQILGAIGGGLAGGAFAFLGGLIGRKKKQGQTAADALKVEVVNSGSIGDAVLSALTKAQLIGAGAAGINNITADLRMQGVRINSA